MEEFLVGCIWKDRWHRSAPCPLLQLGIVSQLILDWVAFGRPSLRLYSLFVNRSYVAEARPNVCQRVFPHIVGATQIQMLEPRGHLVSCPVTQGTRLEATMLVQLLRQSCLCVHLSIRRKSLLFPTSCPWAGSSFLQHWGTWSSQKTTSWLLLSSSLQVSVTW